MTEAIDIKILKCLSQTNEALSSENLAFECQKSSKTIRNHIKKLENIMKESGARIEAKKGFGYTLIINDEKRFSKFMSAMNYDETELQNDDALMSELVHLFITQNDYLKADDLVEKLFISKSKLTQILNQLRLTLKHYDLQLESKPYYGLKILGEEFNFRRFISSSYAQNYELDETIFEGNDINGSYKSMRKEIVQIVKKSLVDFDYPMPSHVLNSFISHLMITILRLSKNSPIMMNDELLHQDASEKEKQLIAHISEKIKEKFQVELPMNEVEYMSLHLVSKRVLGLSDKQHIPMEVNILINGMLERIKESKNIDLEDDLDLRIMLGLHIVPLVSRINYGIELKNPLLDEVKWRCIAAYDLAIAGCEVLEEKYHVSLSEHEISYFALHLDVALNKGASQISKKKILIVCASGRASARLLMAKFEQLFNSYLESIDICDVDEIHLKIENNKYDFIFTTVPLDMSLPLPVFEFSFFLNNTSIKQIQSLLMGNKAIHRIKKYFREDMFFSNVEADSRDEVLNQLFQRLHQVYDLPSGFEELVFEREAFCGTDLMPNTALPHPNRTVTEETFISIMTLKKPVLWNKHKVRLVLMVSISRNDSELYQFLFEMILNLLSSSTAVQRILIEGTYEALKQELIRLEFNEKE